MNENKNDINVELDQINVSMPTPAIENRSNIKKGWSTIIEKLKNVISRFRQNQKVFWLVSVSFVFVILTLIIGLIFARPNKISKVDNQNLTPTPDVETQLAPSPTSELIQIESRLINQKRMITDLDVKQSRLTPPQLDFNISF